MLVLGNLGLLRPALFDCLKNDAGISFCCSRDMHKENDDAIFKKFAVNSTS